MGTLVIVVTHRGAGVFVRIPLPYTQGDLLYRGGLMRFEWEFGQILQGKAAE